MIVPRKKIQSDNIIGSLIELVGVLTLNGQVKRAKTFKMSSY